MFEKILSFGALMIGSAIVTGMVINQHEMAMQEAQARRDAVLQETADAAKKAAAECDAIRIQAEAEGKRRAELDAASADGLNAILADLKKMTDSWKYEESSTFAADAAKRGVEVNPDAVQTHYPIHL